MLDKLLQEYADKFGDNFPLVYVRHLEEKEIIELIKNAINKNEPYEADYSKEGTY